MTTLMRELVMRARDGDQVAFAQLVDRSMGRLTAAARMILGDEQLAQDAVQDTLVEVWRSLPGLRDADVFDAWLRKLLVRACSRRGRREWRRAVIEIPMTPTDEPTVLGTEAAISANDELERALQRLTRDQRAVLVLVYYFDLPLADAATTLDIPTGTMKSRLHRALDALRAVLDADARDPVRAEVRTR